MPWGAYGASGFWWFPVFGFAMMLIMVLVVVVILRPLWGHTSLGRGPEDPVEILRRRYAAGEMTSEEFDERLQRLGRSGGKP